MPVARRKHAARWLVWVAALWGLSLLSAQASPVSSSTTDPDPHRLAARNQQAPASHEPLDTATRRDAIGQLLGLLARHHVDAHRVAPSTLDAWRAVLEAEALGLADEAFWQRLDQQLGNLADSHTRLLSPAQLALRGRELQPGLRGRMQADGRWQVEMVLPGSAAARAGIQAGWQLTHVHGEPLAAALQRAEQIGRAESSPQAALERAMQRLWQASNRPEIGWQLEFEVKHGGPPVRLQIRPDATPLAPRRDRLGEAVERVWLPRIDDEALRFMRDALSAPLRGLVLDLRGNRGGAGAIALALAGLFVEGEHEVARLETRDGEPVRQDGQVVVPLGQTVTGSGMYRGRMVLLVDGGTASSAELLAGVLQRLGRARVIGHRSCGCMNPSLGWFSLPGGAQVLITEARLPLADGTRIEGRGVEPDEGPAFPSSPGDAALALALRDLAPPS